MSQTSKSSRSGPSPRMIASDLCASSAKRDQAPQVRQRAADDETPTLAPRPRTSRSRLGRAGTRIRALHRWRSQSLSGSASVLVYLQGEPEARRRLDPAGPRRPHRRHRAGGAPDTHDQKLPVRNDADGSHHVRRGRNHAGRVRRAGRLVACASGGRDRIPPRRCGRRSARSSALTPADIDACRVSE